MTPLPPPQPAPGLLERALRLATPAAALSPEDRRFLQRRIGLFAGVLLALTGISLVVFPVLLWLYSPVTAKLVFHPVRLLHVAVVVAAFAVWRVCRRGEASVRALYVLEATLAISLGLTLAGVVWLMPEELRGDGAEIGVLLGLSQALAVRAAFIPSTPGRTLLIDAKSVLPVLLVTFLVQMDRTRPAGALPTAAYLGLATFWSVATIAIPALISKVVHGLSERMQKLVRLGQYTLEEKIGEGGMGAVYRARHAFLRRPTAVKLLPPERAGEQAIARFEREVQLTSRLTHPNTIAIYDFGRTPDRVFYYAMEYLDGVTLETLVARDGPQPAGRVIHILAQVAGALGEAHGLGLIHRDVKPANVILCERGGVPDVAKVLDFGLVKDLTGARTRADESNVDVLTGTPLYMSPEAIRDPTTVSAASDVYALAAVGYFLLTGRHAFDAPSLVEVCSLHLHGAPKPASEVLGAPVAADLEAVLLAALAKAPSQRPESADAFAEQLLGCADAGSWSVPRARSWWRTHGRALAEAARRPGTPPSDPLAATVAVDLSGRASG